MVASILGEWFRWKRAGEVVRLAVVADVTGSTAIPEPELTVLVELREAGGMMRQNALAAATGWDRTRLAHLLTRMEARRHLRRDRIVNGVEVRLLDEGQAVIDAARPRLEGAVQRHLLDKLSADERIALHRILLKVLDEDESADAEADENAVEPQGAPAASGAGERLET